MENRRRTPIPENIQRRITKFFVSNLPERCSGSDLAAEVRVHGHIFDLYIARKRDKGGYRFGFISMLDVKDKDDLLKNLRNIRMGDYKLWFSVARFVLEDGEISNKDPVKKKLVPNITNNRQAFEDNRNGGASSFGTGERSFKDMLVGKSINIDSNVNAFYGVHGRAVIAIMVDVNALKNIKVTVSEICPFLEKNQYLGGLDVMLTFDIPENAVVFRDVEGQAFGFERLAWLKVQGIPLRLLTNEVIDEVGSLFGKVVHHADRSESDLDLSYEYVGILLGDGKKGVGGDCFELEGYEISCVGAFENII
ncbi:putative RNA recognition motif domain, nucleotide-binding alpha-beta plait domain superfamily [Helianthus annuus]|nr:putative RNA recognition motif domain, nucleotide-binding alpha-beta plait domain superfamily [Helianthus annuus]